MLLLGVVQAQVSGAESFGSYDLLQTEILTGSASSVVFSDLADYATDYQHLQLRIANKSTVNSYDNFSYMRFNGITPSARYHVLQGDGSEVSSGGGTGSGLICNWHLGSFSGSTDMFGVSVIDILDPFQSTKNTTIRDFSGRVRPDYTRVLFSSAFWDSTDSVTQLSLVSGVGDYTSGSRFSLYGLKKASV